MARKEIDFDKENEYMNAVNIIFNYSYKNNLDFEMWNKKIVITNHQGFSINARLPIEEESYFGRVYIEGDEKQINELVGKLEAKVQ